MKDHLLDLVSHTHDLGCIDLVKISGTETETTIAGMAEDRSVVVDAKFIGPVAEFIGVFGMPNLSKLKILLNLPEYKENARLNIQRRDTGIPESLQFANAIGDFKNSYRFMATEIINEKMKTVKFKGANWHVTFEPTVAAIMRLKMQSQANAEEPNFQVRTDASDLKFYFGDHSTHAGDFVFQPGVSGQIKRAWSYPVAVVIGILGLTGDKTMRISDDGVMQITVDSGLAVYNYILPAQSK
jgi:hypothetical protein